MLSVDQATRAILERARPLPARSTGLAEALGLFLAERVVADLDLPPFDKALMDGYAVRSVDLAEAGEYRLRVVDEIHAGRPSARALGPGEAARIMTGAPLPPGADAVVMSEKATSIGGDVVLLARPVAEGLARLSRGREMRAGEALLEPGTRIGPAAIGLIASAGRSRILAIPRPTVRVVPTGDELVDVDRTPGPGEIRNTNGAMLAAYARAWGSPDVVESPVAPDDPDRLRAILGDALSGADVLLISGGVSAGAKDLVPATLVGLGVEPVFHKVDLKPGKPLWFGVGPAHEGRPGPLVFGLPGNPASGVVGFLLFVRPALWALAGEAARAADLDLVRLATPFQHRGDRPTYHPSRLEGDRATPLDWAGSADLRTLAHADGFVLLAPGNRGYQPGEEIPFLAIAPDGRP